MKLLPSQYGRILFDLTQNLSGKNLDLAIKHFVKFLQKEQAFTKIEYIIEEFVSYTQKKEGIKKLNITTAKKITDKQLLKIVSYFGKKTDVKSMVDKALLGGVVVKDGNTILDASIKSQLKKLKEQLS